MYSSNNFKFNLLLLKLKLKQSWVKSIPLIQISILIIFKSVNLLPYSNAYCYADYCWVIQDLTFYGCLLLTKRLEWLLVSLWSYNAYYIPFITQNVHQQQSCPNTFIKFPIYVQWHIYVHIHFQLFLTFHHPLSFFALYIK
jgi:hypothetical protein